jgi:polyferredoxin
MNLGRLAPLFLAVSIVIIAVDFFLPSTLGGSGLLGDLVAWGLLALSLFFLVLFAAFRRRSF